jgi:hypothetical protein
MNWLLKKLGYRDRQYRGSDFSMRIEPMGREALSVIYTRQGTSLNLDGKRIGSKWEGIEMYKLFTEHASVSKSWRSQKSFSRLAFPRMFATWLETHALAETESQPRISTAR